MNALDQHASCACCRDKGQGSPSVLNQDCNFRSVLAQKQVTQISARTISKKARNLKRRRPVRTF